MKRRWIIRSFFIGLLLLCVGGWVASYMRSVEVGHESRHTVISCWDSPGVMEFFYLNGERNDPRGRGWWGRTNAPGYFSDFNAKSVLGIKWRWEDKYVFLGIPFGWFTIGSLILLWLVWRKTRSPVKGRAFPVEVNKPSG